MIRDDISDKLIHLTRGEKAVDNFQNILREQRLRGGTGNVKSGEKCICFTEAPLSQLSRILTDRMAHDMRYEPFGVMVSKDWLFEKGGRPVVYQPDTEFEALSDDLKYKHVTYEPGEEPDYTWEREWRIRADELVLDPDETTVVVPTREREREILVLHEQMIQRRAAMPFLPGLPGDVVRPPWHFVVLEDLGVPIQEWQAHTE